MASRRNAAAPRTVTAALPDETIALSGLEKLIACDRLIETFTEARKSLLASMRAGIDAVVASGAVGKTSIDEVARTYHAEDNGVTANVQLKAKSIKKLPAEQALRLNNLRIPLRVIPARTVLNPVYAGGALDGDEGDRAADVVKRLEDLVKANPDGLLPGDLFISVPSATVPVEDALLRALQLPQGAREAALEILSTVAFLSISMASPSPLVDALQDQINALGGATAPAKVLTDATPSAPAKPVKLQPTSRKVGAGRGSDKSGPHAK